MAHRDVTTHWKWIEGFILMLLILATILVGERMHQNALTKSAYQVNEERKRTIPAVMNSDYRTSMEQASLKAANLIESPPEK